MDSKRMRAVGIVRHVDQLGRVVLPKDLRKTYRMETGDPVEIFVQGESILLEHYSPQCVFCGTKERIFEFKEKNVCVECSTEIKTTDRSV